MSPVPDRRPNIVIVTAHDLGRHLGCYGIPTVRSPCLDALAQGGVRCSDAFAVTSECAPSWAALFTGRYPHSTGVMGRSAPHHAWQLGAAERHVAELLRSAGYRTALAGANDVGAVPVTRTGSFVAPGAEAAHDPAGARRCGFEEAMPAGRGKAVAEHAVRWLERSARSARPFYLQVGFPEARRQDSASSGSGDGGPDRTGFLGAYLAADDALGVTVPPYVRDTPAAREELAELQGAIRYLDEQVGAVLDALRRLDLEEDTLVVFTTDHGPAVPRAKASLLDSGLGIALIVRWPARGWDGGRVAGELVANIDVVPTVLQGAGAPVHDGAQGVSLCGLLDGEPGAPRDRLFAQMNYHDYYDPIRCVRTATHKMIVYFSNGGSYGDPCASWKPRMTAARKPEPPREPFHPVYELYELTADPGEWRNIVDDPAERSVRDGLLATLHEQMQATGDPLLAGAVTSPPHRWAVEALAAAGGAE